jgi:hypothetical protein
MHKLFVRAGRVTAAGAVAALAMLLSGCLIVLPGGSTVTVKDPLPIVYSTSDFLLPALLPTTPPPGADDWSCVPSAQHPYPVVLVNGPFANEDDNWQALSPLLYDNGYCVYTFNYGGPPLLGVLYGVGDIPTSATQLSSFVDQVLASTGATQVDLVGHSQGGMMPNWYLKFLGGGPKVHDFVALAPDNHGTTLDGITNLATYLPSVGTAVDEGLSSVCLSCVQQEVGSPVITALDASGITVPSVQYTVISTEYDEVVTPWQSQQLTGSNVTDVVLQDQCATDQDGHAGIVYDHIALQDVLNALDPAQAVTPTCTVIGFEQGG